MKKKWKNNKKSQIVILKMMLAVIILIFAIALIKPTEETITGARNASNLNCTNTNITSTQNATCIVTDMGLFYFISTIIALSIAVITGRKTFTEIISTIFVFVSVVVAINPLKDLIVIARDASHFDCTNAAISIGAKMSCLVVDVWLFYFVVFVIATSVTFIFTQKVIPFLKRGE